MSNKQSTERSDADDDLEREIRHGRKFTLEEAIARMAGPGAMKGESPVPLKRQAEVEIESWLEAHLADAAGALQGVLLRRVKESEILLSGFERPLNALSDYCQRVLDSDYNLKELVRESDVACGRMLGERPHFEQAGAPPHPDDCYTVESVQRSLSDLIRQLGDEKA
jgi:hypothetical protein